MSADLKENIIYMSKNPFKLGMIPGFFYLCQFCEQNEQNKQKFFNNHYFVNGYKSESLN